MKNWNKLYRLIIAIQLSKKVKYTEFFIDICTTIKYFINNSSIINESRHCLILPYDNLPLSLYNYDFKPEEWKLIGFELNKTNKIRSLNYNRHIKKTYKFKVSINNWWVVSVLMKSVRCIYVRSTIYLWHRKLMWSYSFFTFIILKYYNYLLI